MRVRWNAMGNGEVKVDDEHKKESGGKSGGDTLDVAVCSWHW